MTCHDGVRKGRWGLGNYFPIHCVGKARSSGVSVSLTDGSVAAVVGHYSDDLSYGEDCVLAYSDRFVILPKSGHAAAGEFIKQRRMLIRLVRCPDILTHQPGSTWIY